MPLKTVLIRKIRLRTVTVEDGRQTSSQKIRNDQIVPEPRASTGVVT